MKSDDVIYKLMELGFVFIQPEFCVRGNALVIVDCIPYIYETGESEAYEFETVEELEKIYYDLWS